MIKQKFTFIDLFAGIGGFRIALEKYGGNCVFSSEFDKYCANIYELNFGETPKGDITKIDETIIPSHDVLAAGFPCQSFSSAGLQKGFEDTRGTLFFDILRIVKEKKPKVLLLENVKNIIYHDKGKTFEKIVKHLKKTGYLVSWKILNAKDFDVPQNRERIIIIGSLTETFDFSKIKYKKIKFKIKNILEDENKNIKFLSPNEYILINSNQIKEQNSGLIFVGYRKKPIRKNGARPNTEHLSRVHKQCNRIYSSEGNHPTLSSSETAGRYFVYHNKRVRKLTLKECCRLMGFPEDFKKNSSNSEGYKQIGNSIAIPMLESVIEQIKKQLLK